MYQLRLIQNALVRYRCGAQLTQCNRPHLYVFTRIEVDKKELLISYQGRDVKSRDLTRHVSYGPVWLNRLNKETKTEEASAINYPYHGRQFTVSEGHRRSRHGKYYEGGEFFTYRIDVDVPSRQIDVVWPESGFRQWEYAGGATCPITFSYYGGHKAPDEDSSHLDPIGAEAISIVDPTNPNADLGVALGEIAIDRKISIPGIQAWRRRLEPIKAAGSEYLSAVFGWVPLVSEIKNTAQSVKDGNTIIENYSNASGTDVHREFEFPTEESESSEVVYSGARASYHPLMSIGPATYSGPGTDLTRHRKTTVKRWFSGSFTYKAGSSSSIATCLGYGSDADKLFGVALTPDLVWELTPWSWAIDWFSNAGNVIFNASAMGLAGLVMRYGYIMEETSIVDTYSLPYSGLIGVDGTVPPITVTYTVKRRREANPFGFGLTWDGLSPTQLAITAALGITRLR